MIMHKANDETEAGIPPSPELIAAMGSFIPEAIQSGVLEAAEGLRPSSMGVRLNFSGGKRTVTKGPFRGSNELIAGYCIMRVKSLDEAIEWSSRFAELIGDAEIDMRPLTEPWDLGICPKPSGDPTIRFMAVHKADRNSEANTPPGADLIACMNKLIGDMKEAGVLVSTGGLQPSSSSVRLNFSQGKRRMTDGPFTESKELIGGFTIARLPSREEAVEWASRFAHLLSNTGIDNIEIDIRPMHEMAESAR
jgi:hypothetical protein